MDISYEIIEEYKLSKEHKTKIVELIQLVFPDVNYEGRTYYKQLPHHRLLIKKNEEIIGQIALDYRAMRLNNQLIHVLGIIDFMVHPTYQSKGIGTKSLNYLINHFKHYQSNIDFIYLVTDIPAFYENIGFSKTELEVKWMAIDKLHTHSILNQKVDDCHLMYLPLSDKIWNDGTLDMFGYWY